MQTFSYSIKQDVKPRRQKKRHATQDLQSEKDNAAENRARKRKQIIAVATTSLNRSTAGKRTEAL